MPWNNLINDAFAFTPEKRTVEVRIAICGIGGAGNNSLTRISKMGIKESKLLSFNTDQIALENNESRTKMLLGKNITKGRGTGGSVEIGERVAEAAKNEISAQIQGNELVFILAGLGGGTGSGSGPVLAGIAKSLGALVISIVTMPFKAEGNHRQIVAKHALKKFQENSHTVIVLDNNKLLEMEPNLPLNKAFSVMDYITSDLIKNISDTINVPSMMNIDFADLNNMMRRGGTSTILYGEGAINNIPDVIEDTLNTKLLEIDTSGATGAIVHVTAGKEMTLKLLNRIVEGLTARINDSAEVKIGARIDESYTGKVKITTLLTGITDLHTSPNRRAYGYGMAVTDFREDVMVF